MAQDDYGTGDDWFRDNAPPDQPPNQGPPPAQAPQNWDQGTFAQMFGQPGTPEELAALEGQLGQYGIKVMRNAAGVAGKIQLPNGQIVDVINSAGAGGKGFQWLTGDGGGGGLTGAGLAPYDKQYNLPSLEELQNMPGYQAGLQASQQALQNSAAARGTLLTGGTLKAANQNAVDYANQQYANLANLGMGAFDRNYQIFKDNQDRPFNKLYQVASLGKPA